MTTLLRKEIEAIVEQKLQEFFDDPDNGLGLKKSLVTQLKKNMAQKKRSLVTHANMLKKYGLR